jgi:flagellar basal-body rod modification protein FlgD
MRSRAPVHPQREFRKWPLNAAGKAGLNFMSTISSINPTLSSNSTPDTLSGSSSQTLSQNDFLQLLVTQMTSQDPMNPTSDTQMAAQMAQFTALQQTNTMSTNIASMLTQQQVLQANDMLGKTVTLQVDANTTASGLVSSMQLVGGVPKIVVNNTPYDLSQVLTIAPTP